MPNPIKPVPIKYCSQCGALLTRKRYNGTLESMNIFLRRKFCDAKCMGLHRLKDAPTLAALRKRAEKFKGDVCQRCGATEHLDIHHLDGNPANNESSNLMTLCGSCHTKWHWEHGKKPHKKRLACKICGKLSKKYGLCQKHYARLKRHGDPCMTMKRNGSQFVLVKVDA